MIEINKALVDGLTEKAKVSSRKRLHHNFHTTQEDTIHRMLNSLCYDTYIRPHKHENPDKREAFIILKGSVLIVEFDDKGNVIHHFILDPNKGNYGAEIPPGTYHTLVSISETSVIYEVKDGPYDVKSDKIFAEWSPEEGSEECVDFINNLRKYCQ